MKSIIKKLFIVTMTLCLSLVSKAADVVVINGIYYNLSTINKTAMVISNPNKYTGIITIPKSFTYGGTEFRVTSIGDCAFSGCNGLTSISIPDGITRIGEEAFSGCYRLISIIIPNSVTYIDSKAFVQCSGLTSISIGNSVTYIGTNAFRQCSGLTSVTIPNSVTNIREGTFYGCSGLTSITIGSGVTSIDNYAFTYCSKLSVIYNFATKIPTSSFGDNSNAFEKTPIEDVTLYVPASLIEQYKAKIPWYRFGTIAPLDYIDGIYYNFTDDEAEVTYRDESYNSYSGNVIIPTFVTSVWGNTYTVKSVGDHAFLNCKNLTSVIIPNSVNNIGIAAFDGCSSLTSISLPDNVTSIGNVAFRNCQSLSTFTIPNNVKTIKVGVFFGCKSLKSITIPNNIEQIGNFAFQDCKNLTDVYCLSESVPQTNGTAFDNSPINTATLHIPNCSIHLYRKSTPWKNFGRFVGLYGNEYNLYYKIDGNEYKTFKVWEEEKITAEEEPTKEGYTFSGWSEIPETMPANDVTVTGYFSINKYKLTYMVDGIEYESYEIEYGTKIIPEAEPTKDGYSFSGWGAIPATMPAEDVTVDGTFSVNKYKLTYNVDGEKYKTIEVEYGKVITPEIEPEKEGYMFSGWGEIPAIMPAEDVTVTGTFTKGAYNLIYMVDGEVYKTMAYDFGNAITPETEPTKNGYTFSGWSEIPATMPAEDVTVTGTFSKNEATTYKLTYMVDGQVYSTFSYEYGATITPLAAPTKDGCTFSGWSEIPAKMPDEDVIVTGTFDVEMFKLTYKVDGEEYKTIELEAGAKITPEPAPTKEGYDFSGWSWIPSKMPDEDVTITGTFTPTTGVDAVIGNGKPFDVYSTTGVLLRRQVRTMKGLPAGFYIVNGKKVYVRRK